MGTVACCAKTCCKCCLSCSCWSCCMDSYLHVYIRSISLTKEAVRSGDMNIGGKIDVYCELIWGPWRQISSVHKGESGTVAETEPIILENAEPDDPEANNCLIVQVWDADSTSADDFIAAARVEINLPYGENLGEREFPLWTNPEGKPGSGKEAGKITLDQIHFIKQKLMPYRGCKCQCCCCDENAPFLCCLETAQSLTYKQFKENQDLAKAKIQQKSADE